MTAFTFGENWLRYSRLIDEPRIEEAMRSIQQLLGRPSLEQWSVLDVGSGSGLFAIACVRLGARRVLAIDRDENSVAAARQNVTRFLTADGSIRVDARCDDILEPHIGPERFDVVYAWGSLHHTGAMWRAIENASNFCRRDGYFVLAIYNRTWSSPWWLRIKHLYHNAPQPFRGLMVAVLTTARALARAAQLKDPFATGRGMNVRYDAIDWLGGLPYECATAQEVTAFMRSHRFTVERQVLTRRLGCNEFVFKQAGTN